jgi:outer membrane protein OmpA-like peptidoglycan-associated protein
LQLSTARADAVRRWLVENIDVNPDRVQIRGFGSSKLVVAPRPYDSASQASLDEEKRRQAPNRRVEIVFRFAE